MVKDAYRSYRTKIPNQKFRNIFINGKQPLKHETNKTERNPPITNQKPGPLELVQVNVCLLRWLREQKTQNSFEFQNAQRGTTNFAVILKLVLKILLIY